MHLNLTSRRRTFERSQSWSDELVLRDDAGTGDIGYPRTVLRGDGKLVTCYYYADEEDGERYIGGTVWQPPPAASPAL